MKFLKMQKFWFCFLLGFFQRRNKKKIFTQFLASILICYFFKLPLKNQPNMYLLICNDSWVIWCVHLQAPQMLIWLALCLNEVILKVLYTNCVPAAREISAGDMCHCHAAINDAEWKIFSYAIWDSIRHLQLSLCIIIMRWMT